MFLIRRRITGALALASFVMAAGWAGAETISAEAQRQKMEKRISKVEERLAAVPVTSPKSEILTNRAKAQLELSRRFLNANDTAAARIHTDVAERLAAAAESKAVQR